MNRERLRESIIFGLGISLIIIASSNGCNSGDDNGGKLNTKPYHRLTYKPLGEIISVEQKATGKSLAAIQDTITVLYRISSRQVLDISVKGNPFAKANAKYYQRSVNPVFIDGTDETISKIIVLRSGIDTVRNATTQEEAIFQATVDSQLLDEELDAVSRRIDQDPQFRKFVKALVKMLVKEFNRSRALDGVPLLTETQALNALKNELSKND